MAIIHRQHARDRMVQRGILEEWVEATITSPDWTTPNSRPGITRSFKAIVAASGKTLRVAHRPDRADIVVITAVFDSRARKP